MTVKCPSCATPLQLPPGLQNQAKLSCPPCRAVFMVKLPPAAVPAVPAPQPLVAVSAPPPPPAPRPQYAPPPALRETKACAFCGGNREGDQMNKQPAWLSIIRLMVWGLAFIVMGLVWLAMTMAIFQSNNTAIQEAAGAAIGAFQMISVYCLARAIVFALDQIGQFSSGGQPWRAPPVRNGFQGGNRTHARVNERGGAGHSEAAGATIAPRGRKGRDE
jgi:LSD1 subclass zinc finger protein